MITGNGGDGTIYTLGSKNIVRALGMLTMLLIFGTLGYRIIEHWGLLDALYMTVITITTVGYGEMIPFMSVNK